MKINVLIVGGAGYIGSVFADYLDKLNNYKIVIVDNLSTGFKENIIPNAKFYNVDMLDSEKMIHIMKKEEINFVVVFAAKLIVGESMYEPIDYFANNVGGIISILSAMKFSNVKNIIFSSTAAVYGEPKKVPVNENDEKNPINPYGTSKLACENLITASNLAYGINYGILRYFNVVGASDNNLYGLRKKNPTLLIPVICKSIIENSQINIFGNDYKTKDGTCIRDYIHVVDLVRAHQLLMEKMFNSSDVKNNNFILNLGSKKGFSVLEVVKKCDQVLNKKVNYKISERRLGDPAELITNISEVKKQLNWEPEKTLDDMIKSEYEYRCKLY